MNDENLFLLTIGWIFSIYHTIILPKNDLIDKYFSFKCILVKKKLYMIYSFVNNLSVTQ